jgi:hypothetical protein
VITDPAMSDAAVVVVASDVLGSELGSEVVMLNLRDATYYGLDEVGAEVWKLIQRPITLGDVVASLVNAYDVDPQRCRSDIINLLAVLRERGLVEVRDEA